MESHDPKSSGADSGSNESKKLETDHIDAESAAAPASSHRVRNIGDRSVYVRFDNLEEFLVAAGALCVCTRRNPLDRVLIRVYAASADGSKGSELDNDKTGLGETLSGSSAWVFDGARLRRE